MLNRVQYPAAIEPLVQFIEETPPAEILDRALEKLRGGIPVSEMLTASALASAGFITPWRIGTSQTWSISVAAGLKEAAALCAM